MTQTSLTDKLTDIKRQNGSGRGYKCLVVKMLWLVEEEENISRKCLKLSETNQIFIKSNHTDAGQTQRGVQVVYIHLLPESYFLKERKESREGSLPQRTGGLGRWEVFVDSSRLGR